jgi:hypothetical protein
METAKCDHTVTTKSLSGGVNIYECANCGQQVEYSLDKYKQIPPKVLRLGRIGHNIVLPDPSYRLALGSIDREDLRVVLAGKGKTAAPELKATPPQSAKPGETPGIRPKETAARLKWYRQWKKAMIDDLVTMSFEDFIAKWEPLGVNSYMIARLRYDKYYKKKMAEPAPAAAEKPKRKKMAEPAPAAAEKPKRKNPGPKTKPKGEPLSVPAPAGLPPLPEWDPEWPTPVKLKWLEVYEKILCRGGKDVD